jgi:hypothetical protein
MLEISNNAMTFLKSALEAEAPENSLFRLVLTGDSLALRVASAEEGDIVYEQGGVAVVAAPADLAEELGSQVLDIEETSRGPQLVMST